MYLFALNWNNCKPVSIKIVACFFAEQIPRGKPVSTEKLPSVITLPGEAYLERVIAQKLKIAISTVRDSA